MNGDADGEPLLPASRHLNIVPATDGQAYISAHDAVRLLRAIADSCRNLAHDSDADLYSAAAAFDYEADTLDCRAIEYTR